MRSMWMVESLRHLAGVKHRPTDSYSRMWAAVPLPSAASAAAVSTRAQCMTTSVLRTLMSEMRDEQCGCSYPVNGIGSGLV